MNVKFKYVKLSNFLSFECATFSLDDSGFVLINGINNSLTDEAKSNGSGKSSILEAIVWSITGETIRGTKDVVRQGTDACCVEIEFEYDNHIYRIARTREGSSSLYFFVDGEDKSGKGIRDTQKILEDHLPELTKNLLESVIVLGQGLPNRFTSNTPSGRKEILERLTKSDFMIQDIKDRISEREECIKNEISSVKFDIEKCSFMITDLGKRIEEYESSLSGLDEGSLNEEIKSLSEEIERASSDKKLWEERLSVLEKKIDVLYGELSVKQQEARKEEKKLQDRRVSLMEDFATVSLTYEKKIENLQGTIIVKESVYDVCPTCGRKMDGVVKHDTTEDRKELSRLKYELSEMDRAYKEDKSDIERKIFDIMGNLQTIEGETSTKIADLKKEQFKIKGDISTADYKLKEFTRTISEKRAQLSMCVSEKESIEKSISSLKSRIEDGQLQKDKLEERLYHLNDSFAVITKMNTIASRDFRGVLLGSIIEYLDRRAKEFSKLVFGNESIKINQDGNNLNISFCNKLYESLSGGEQKKIDIIVQFAIRDLLCNYMNFSCNFLAIDEIFDSLDMTGCQKIVEFISKELSDIQTVFIITHRQDLQVPCDEEIVIVKNENGVSSIQ